MPLTVIPELHRATHRVALVLAEVAPGISQAEAHVLAHLHSNMACPIGELQKVFGHKPSTLTSVIDRLQKRGLVKRERTARDRRSFIVRPTRAGQTTAARVFAVLANIELGAIKRVSRADVDGFLALASKIGSAE
jgi:DNA-binding MarR family transcriptional regulator